HFARKRIELVHHGVDGAFQLGDFALNVDGDLAREVAARHGGGHLGDVAHLGRQVTGHRVHRVGEILPGVGSVGRVGRAAESAFGAYVARLGRHLAGEAVELVDHGVERFLQLKDLAAHVDRDLAREVAAGDGGRHLRDVAHLAGQVAGHRVHAVGQVLPGTADARHLRLAAELAFGADFARHARRVGDKHVELIDHGVGGVFQLENFAAHVDRNLAREVAARHRGRHLGDVADLAGEVRGHGVDRVGQILPGAGDTAHHRLTAELAFGADFA